MQPYDLSFPIIVAPGMSGIRIDLTAVTGNAVISGIQIDAVDLPQVTYAPYVTGLESAAPVCPAIGLTFFYATDTDHLFRCFGGGEWKVVGDVRNAPAATLRECKGSGPGWDCAGLLWATFPLSTGVLDMVGAPMPGFASSAGTTWTEKH